MKGSCKAPAFTAIQAEVLVAWGPHLWLAPEVEAVLRDWTQPTKAKVKAKMKSLSRVRLFATPWTVAYHAAPSMGFSRQEYWSVLPFLV